MTRSHLWAVIPVKNVENAKQRLAGTLSPNERQTLFLAMVEDVLTAVSAADGLAGVMLVTREPAAVRLAECYGARVLIEPENAGHTAASSFGANTLANEGAVGMLQLPGDIAGVTTADIDAVLAAHGEAPSVTIAPSRDQLGSNAVACSPPDLLPLRFGDDSYFPHLQSARDLGIEPRVVKRGGLALDLDTPEDLAAFLAVPSPTRAYAYLTETGIARRVADQAD